MGVRIDEDYLSNLRFADDVLLIGKARAQVRQMLEDMVTNASAVGLKLHMGKTKILSNVHTRRGVLRQSFVNVAGSAVEVLAFDQGVPYLGRILCFADFYDAEIKHRISKGWAVFASLRDELCGKHYPLRARLRLFDACVSSAVLYGSGSWTMNACREHLLTSAYRKMLRKIVRTPRQMLGPEGDELEPWVAWVVRATHRAEAQMHAMGFSSWVVSQRRRKEKLFKRTIDDGQKWSAKIYRWQPEGHRRVGRPVLRWSDSLAAQPS
jgi:hypothetical protein